MVCPSDRSNVLFNGAKKQAETICLYMNSSKPGNGFLLPVSQEIQPLIQNHYIGAKSFHNDVVPTPSFHNFFQDRKT